MAASVFYSAVLRLDDIDSKIRSTATHGFYAKYSRYVPQGLGHFVVGLFDVKCFGVDFSVHGHFGVRTFWCTDVLVYKL